MSAKTKIFREQIGKWAGATDAKIDALARQVCQEMGEQAVTRTPVDTGFLRGSWQPSIGAPAQAEGSEDKGGARALASLGVLMADMKAGDTFFMINNAAYALRVEFGFVGTDSLGRKYNQPARYYVTDTIKGFHATVDKVAAELGMAK